jgi:hypothetical protein
VKNGTTPATNTNITVEWLSYANVNRLDVGTVFHSETTPVSIDSTQNIVKGDKQNNTATASGDAFEALVAVANAAAPTRTEGSVVVLRTNLAGDLVVTLDGETVPVSGTITASNATGNVANGVADSGNPVKVGGRVETSLASATMLADANRSDLVTDMDGVQYFKLFPEADLITERVTDTTGTATAFTNFGATASARNLVYGYSVFNASATDGFLDLRDGVAGTVLWTIPLPKGGGANIVSPFPICKTAANTALAYDVSAALTTVYISVVGRKSKVT